MKQSEYNIFQIKYKEPKEGCRKAIVRFAEGVILSGVSVFGNRTVVGWRTGESQKMGAEGESRKVSANLSGKRTVFIISINKK